MTIVKLWGDFGAVGSHECLAFNAYLHKGFETLPKVSKPWVNILNQKLVVIRKVSKHLPKISKPWPWFRNHCDGIETLG
ncbi:hypothetical protein GQ457_11G029650 [Hibiscus cannabinus]